MSTTMRIPWPAVATEAYPWAAVTDPFDPTGGYFPSYGAVPYASTGSTPQGTPYGQGRWDDGSPMSGGIRTPNAEAYAAWEVGEVFVPHPRAPAVGTDDAPPARSSRRRPGPPRPPWPQALGSLLGLLTAVAVTAVCLVGWTLSYDPLRDLAFARGPRGLAQLWPVIVYGPWLVGSLSVLRAALDGRRVAHSWAVVVMFSVVATVLCVADVSRALPDMVVAGLPPITGAISLHQLVRQLGSVRGARRSASRSASHKASR
ncbi:DUF2637 domain-containing protein [Kitasatospora sp. NPDC057015]|uniref:DUF2637 domain-containing protein n=1 Tax=Kitasatospora sp. NPDC057015 TaxID=3346001 RepID=UPI00363EBCC5